MREAVSAGLVSRRLGGTTTAIQVLCFQRELDGFIVLTNLKFMIEPTEQLERLVPPMLWKIMKTGSKLFGIIVQELEETLLHDYHSKTDYHPKTDSLARRTDIENPNQRAFRLMVVMAPWNAWQTRSMRLAFTSNDQTPSLWW
jgi:hypothetical protein